MPKRNNALQADDAAWRHFPQFEESFGAGKRSGAYTRIEHTCRRLDALIHAGSAEDRSRAATAMNGYARLLELVNLVSEQQAKAGQATTQP